MRLAGVGVGSEGRRTTSGECKGRMCGEGEKDNFAKVGWVGSWEKLSDAVIPLSSGNGRPVCNFCSAPSLLQKYFPFC